MKTFLKYAAVFLVGSVLGTITFLYVIANYLGNNPVFGK